MSAIEGDTIVARATARGTAAIAMIRLSGEDAVRIAQKCFSGSDLADQESHTAHVGYIQSDDGSSIDQVVLTLFRSPRSVTGENVVEITCHGGEVVCHRIIAALMAAGARPARPGEFTQRAFLNGKMDLAQAEAVSELIQAGSIKAQATSLSNLKGSYSILLSELRDEMLDLCSFVELELDFSEEDVEFADRKRLEELLRRTQTLLDDLITSYRYGSVLRDGVKVVLAGKPNAGKSTLLNALVGFDRAIVSETPGTTRDEIGEEKEFEGVLFKFLDTAGIRETENEIEAEGVRRAEASIKDADALIYVYDATVGMDQEERDFASLLKKEQGDKPILIVRNKSDLVQKTASTNGEYSMSALQAMRDESLARPLLADILNQIQSDESHAEGSFVVTNERHMYHLNEAQQAVSSALTAMESQASGDIIALDLRVAMKELGAITGATATEDILDRIFSRFCIGK